MSRTIDLRPFSIHDLRRLVLEYRKTSLYYVQRYDDTRRALIATRLRLIDADRMITQLIEKGPGQTDSGFELDPDSPI